MRSRGAIPLRTVLFRFFAVVESATITLNDVALRNRYATSHCGAISNAGTTILVNSTLSGNSAPWCGAIGNEGTAILVNSTLSGNSATVLHGGGMFNSTGIARLTNSTVSGNSGGLSAYQSDAFSRNSIVANNSGPNCSPGWSHSSIVDHGNNFSDDDSCPSGFADITPDVDFDTILADNGGPTQTHALLPESVAADAAGECGLETDQRGMPRNDDACDSGSYEFQCTIMVTREGADTLILFTPDSSEFDVVAGYTSDLLSDKDFSRATCLGTFSTSPAVDTLPEPPAGDGRCYLARGLTSCVGAGYGDSSLTPDPRDDSDLGPCP